MFALVSIRVYQEVNLNPLLSVVDMEEVGKFLRTGYCWNCVMMTVVVMTIMVVMTWW